MIVTLSRFGIAVLALLVLLVVIAGAVGGTLLNQGVLLFSLPLSPPPNPAPGAGARWQVRLFDVRTQMSLPVWDYASNRFATAFQWSPDGRRIAGLIGNTGTLVLDVFQNSSFMVEKAYEVSWSPDGNHFAVMMSTSRDYKLYVGSAADASLYPLETSRQNNMYPDWSADGRRIVFESQDDFSVNAIGIDGSGEQPISAPGSRDDWDRLPVWSPDGQFIAYLHTLDNEHGRHKTLNVIALDQPDSLLLSVEIGTLIGRPAWSPNSRYIALITNNPTSGADDLYVVDMHGDYIPRRVAENVYYVYYTTWNMWSPDSRHLVFSPLIFTPNNQPTLANALYRIDVATWETTRLADIPAAYPIWQPR